MYELYDKNGNQIGYRMTKRIKNEDGKYDVLTARSKTSEKDCRKKLDDMVKEYYQLQEKKKSGGVFSEMKLKDYADNWYHLNIEKANCTKKNKYMYKNIVYNHIIEHLGSIKLCNLTEDDCQRFINEYAGWSKTFASKVRMVLRRILTKAEKQELIKTNVAKDIVLPTVYENKHRPITDDERRMILETIPKHYAGTMVLTMLCCGLRPIEIRRMKWDWIDFENAILTVGKSKTEAGTGRKIPIPPVLLDALKEHKTKELNNEYVFVKYEKHTRMDDNAFYQSWKNFVKEMDLANGAHLYRNQVKGSVIAPDFEPYLLRHTFCTDCQAAGVPINVAKEWMGHSDISVTAKIYTHMVDEVFEQNRMRMAQYAVTKSQQVESLTATN